MVKWATPFKQLILAATAQFHRTTNDPREAPEHCDLGAPELEVDEDEPASPSAPRGAGPDEEVGGEDLSAEPGAEEIAALCVRQGHGRARGRVCYSYRHANRDG